MRSVRKDFAVRIREVSKCCCGWISKFLLRCLQYIKRSFESKFRNVSSQNFISDFGNAVGGWVRKVNFNNLLLWAFVSLAFISVLFLEFPRIFLSSDRNGEGVKITKIEDELATARNLAKKNPHGFYFHLLLNIDSDFVYFVGRGTGFNAMWGDVSIEADRIMFDEEILSIGRNFGGFKMGALKFQKKDDQFIQLGANKAGKLVLVEQMELWKVKENYTYVKIADHYLGDRRDSELVLKIPRNESALSHLLQDRENNKAFRQAKRVTRRALLEWIREKVQ